MDTTEKTGERVSEVVEEGNTLTFEYLYSGYSKNYTFMKMPKILFSRDEFRGMSSDAKILYMFMLELAKYSELNDWTDETGRLFVIVKIRELMKKLKYIFCYPGTG